MIRVGVIGYGYWGPNLVRNFMGAQGSAVVSVSDLHEERLSPLRKIYPALKTISSASELIHDREVDAVVIATPVSSHFELALAALKAGKHVLVEKPLASTSDQAQILIDEAARQKLVLMVLAIHDLSIMDCVLPSKPVAISATGISHVPGQPENVAYITLFFANNQIAHIHVNWLTPVKVRHTLIGGSEKMILYDDLDPSEKLKVYDKGITVTPGPEDVYKMLVSYRSGDMWAPRLDNTEALHTEALHFIDCVENNRQPETDGAAGLRMVKMIEAAEQSLHGRGGLVEFEL